ncbi:MAG: hypothetical protein M3Y36_03500 [Actinomycetota bacterium]|nr:hypothetical protein [Actinomycetota bacterium]
MGTPPIYGPYVMASAVPADMATYTKDMLPYDDAIGTTAVSQLLPAWQALADSKPDPTMLAPSVWSDPLPTDVQRYAETCHTTDLFPAQVGQAFAAADGGIVNDAQLSAELAKLQAQWKLPGNLSYLVPGQDWSTLGGFGICPTQPGGFIKGPDGQYYALTPAAYFSAGPQGTKAQPAMGVAPSAMPQDGTAWQQVGARTGFVGVGKAPDASVKGAAIMMSILNPEAVDHDLQAAGKSTYDHTDMGMGGPKFVTGGSGTGFSYSVGPTETGQSPTGSGEAGASLAGAIGLGTESGVSWASSMNSQPLWQYQVKYFQGPGGTRRAELDMYKIWNTKDGGHKLESGVGSVGPDGHVTVGTTTMTDMETP